MEISCIWCETTLSNSGKLKRHLKDTKYCLRIRKEYVNNLPFNKSIASHEKAKYWSNKNELTALEVKAHSNKKYLFDCPCGHEILKSPNR